MLTRTVRFALFVAEALLLMLTVSCFAGCTFSLPARSSTVTILSWNVQNLFDDGADGNEYEEYDPSRSRWSTAEYYRRLEDIARVIRDSTRGGPDVVALQEIEHAGILEDLKERYLAGLGYRDLCAVESDGSPTVVGVLSRFPFRSANTHGARIDSRQRLRPMLEVEFDAGSPLTLVVCHWKSKSGGAGETEPYRIAAAEALASLVAERIACDPFVDLVVMGDLNEEPEEELRVRGAYPTALFLAEAAHPTDHDARRGIPVAPLPATPGDTPDIGGRTLYSPWLSSNEAGSYRFRGSWERIDHALLSAGCFDGSGLDFDAFEVISPEYAVTPDGTPLGYSPRTGTGFSDHLPILVTLRSTR